MEAQTRTRLMIVVAGIGMALMVVMGGWTTYSSSLDQKNEQTLQASVSELSDTAREYHAGIVKGKTAEDAATEWNEAHDDVKARVITSGNFVTVQVVGFGEYEMKTASIRADSETITGSGRVR